MGLGHLFEALPARAALLGCLMLLAGAAPAPAAFPGQNGAVAFQHSDDLWLSPSAGAAATRLTGCAGSAERDPAWSADGNQIAYTRYKSEQDVDVWSIDGRTGTLRQLTSDPARDFAPAFSPDGQRIAFISHRGAAQRLWVMNADGSGAAPITAAGEPGPRGAPSWSPDGHAWPTPTPPASW